MGFFSELTEKLGIDTKKLGLDTDKLSNLTKKIGIDTKNYQRCGDTDTKWHLDEDTGTLTISGKGEMPNYFSDENQPWHSKTVYEIVIKSGVTKIGFGAFRDIINCIKVTIPDSVKVIKADAFNRCKSLKVISCNALYIGDRAFQHCSSLETVEMNNAKLIGYCAFYNCSNLKKISIKNVEEIEGMAFYDCMRLQECSWILRAKIAKDSFSGSGLENTIQNKTIEYNEKKQREQEEYEERKRQEEAEERERKKWEEERKLHEEKKAERGGDTQKEIEKASKVMVKISGSHRLITVKKNFTMKFPFLKLDFGIGRDLNMSLRDYAYRDGEMYLCGSSSIKDFADQFGSTFASVRVENESISGPQYRGHTTEEPFYSQMSIYEVNEYGRKNNWQNFLTTGDF